MYGVQIVENQHSGLQYSRNLVIEKTILWLDMYFSGKMPDFVPDIEFCGSDFQKKVWKELMNLPFGEPATYGDISRRLGCRSAQAVGGAVGKNPILIIVPCHRVLAANGRLGGFSAGLERKIWLLNHEKISFVK